VLHARRVGARILAEEEDAIRPGKIVETARLVRGAARAVEHGPFAVGNDAQLLADLGEGNHPGHFAIAVRRGAVAHRARLPVDLLQVVISAATQLGDCMLGEKIRLGAMGVMFQPIVMTLFSQNFERRVRGFDPGPIHALEAVGLVLLGQSKRTTDTGTPSCAEHQPAFSRQAPWDL
jgi:hypothetical protein